MDRRTIIGLLVCALLAGCGAGRRDAEAARTALAPGGALRVGLLDSNAVHLVREPGGEMKGVSHDLGRALAERLGVPFQPLVYPTIVALVDGGRKGEWDVSFMGVTEERATFLDFTPNHLEIEYGYLVPAGSMISAIEELDCPGMRLAVVAKGSPDAFLTSTLKSATLLRSPALPGAVELFEARKADVLAALKPNIYSVSARFPGARVLPGRLGAEGAALALPKGRGAAAIEYARHFIREARESGLVQRAIERAGLRGAIVAP